MHNPQIYLGDVSEKKHKTPAGFTNTNMPSDGW